MATSRSNFYQRRQNVLLCILFAIYENYIEFEQGKAYLGAQRNDFREFTAEIFPEYAEDPETLEEDITQSMLAAWTANYITAGGGETQAKRYVLTDWGFQYLKSRAEEKEFEEARRRFPDFRKPRYLVQERNRE